MGVVESIPDDLMGLYGDFNYSTDADGGSAGPGYADYSYTAEHGVAWAATLVELLAPQGARVLDIGCADGHLLKKLGTGYARFGIEANEEAGGRAARHDITVLGRDLLDPAIVEGNRRSFHFITAIAVFEHLRDIRAGMLTALEMLREDGVLLFEVPLMSTSHDNSMWLGSSLEHVWYPSEESLQWLVKNALKTRLIGAEVHVRGYASTYIGLVFRDSADDAKLREIATRVLLREGTPGSTEEARASMLLHLVHAATSTLSDIGVLADCPPQFLNPALLRRLAEIWQADLRRLQLMRDAMEKANREKQSLQADMDAMALDRVRSLTELTTQVVALEARLAAAKTELDRQAALLATYQEQQAALVQSRRDLDAAVARLTIAEQAVASADETVAAKTAQIQALQAGAAWRVVGVLREVRRRYPRASRQALRATRLLWWTARGRLVTRLKARRRLQAQSRATARFSDPPQLPPATPILHPVAVPPTHAVVPPLPVSQPRALLDFRTDPDHEIAILEATGHRPPLPADLERQADWPLVSVIVTSFNYGKFVADAVDSVLMQTFKDLEVIVVEGGSSDPNSRFAAAELQRPRTRILMQGPGHRAGANRNFGISQARGRYVCCLDADDALAPTYIEKAVFLLERHGYDVVSCAMELTGEDRGRVDIMEAPDLGNLLVGNHVLTCAVFRRSWWHKAGGYRDVDRALSGHVHEDWVFWVRLAALGARFRNLAYDPMLRYRVHGVSLSRSDDVLPMWRQQQIVRQINQDVLESVADAVSRSRDLAALAYGTPSAPMSPIRLDRTPAETVPPTLLLVLPYMVLGGAERLLSAIVGDLVQQRWRIVIVTTIKTAAEQGDTSAWFEAHTREIFHLPRGMPRETWEDFLHHLVGSRKVDLLWLVGSVFAYDSLRGLRFAYPGLRIVDLLFNTVGHAANNRRRRDMIDLTFVENNEVADWLVAHGETHDRICMVASGVDVVALQPRSPIELRQRLRANTGDLIIGFSGRWSEEKNPLGFIEIARQADPSLPLRFVMTGTGHQRAAIEAAIRNAKFAPGRFCLMGEVEELEPVLGGFDLLVLPSILDGRPMVVLEAMAMGVPVLASRVGALPELIQPGSNGWLADPEDLQEFLAIIEGAARDPAFLPAMRLRARAYAEERLNIRTMLSGYTSRLASLLPEGRRHG